jgi:6-phosphogluconolactonase (cycloisomerase 2 family)
VSKRSILVNLAMLVPALALCAAVLSTVSCGGGLFPEVTATATSSSSPTPGTGEFGYVTDFNTGKVVMLTRNVTTGGISRGKAVDAGAKKGPKGLALTFGNNFLYVANNGDDNIYAYSIPSGGVPSPLPTPSFSDGSGSAPEQIAINPSSNLLWVTNGGNGSITYYAINTSTGELTNNGSLTGLNSPFGVITDGTYLYVADHGAGTVNSYTINTTTGAITLLSSVSNLGSGVAGGTPVKLAFDPSGSFIYVDDQTTGTISSIGVSSGVLSQAVAFFPSSTIGPIGLAVAQLSSGNFLLAAYQASSLNNIGSYPISPAGTLLTPNLSSLSVSAPTGIVVDPQNANAYTANQGDGTVAQWTLTGSCGGPTACFVGKIATESGSTTTGPFDVILTH